MLALVYTHYVGALYLASAVIAIWICNVPRKTKVLAFLSAFLAVLCLAPWILAVKGAYQAQHGLSNNLSWLPAPNLIDMAHLLGSAIGILKGHGGTPLALFLVTVLSLAGDFAIRLHSSRCFSSQLCLLRFCLRCRITRSTCISLSSGNFFRRLRHYVSSAVMVWNALPAIFDCATLWSLRPFRQSHSSPLRPRSFRMDSSLIGFLSTQSRRI